MGLQSKDKLVAHPQPGHPDSPCYPTHRRYRLETHPHLHNQKTSSTGALILTEVQDREGNNTKCTREKDGRNDRNRVKLFLVVANLGKNPFL